MKRILGFLTAWLCLLTAFTSARAEMPYALYAVSAGKADALLLKVQDAVYLIDTGFPRSRGRILYAMEQLGAERLDGVFITHTDNDHTAGLTWLAESDIPVGGWYAPAMYTGVKAGKHPAENAAAIRGEKVTWLQAGDAFRLGESVLEVLAPGTLFTDKDDNNSLVLMLRTPAGNMLLCGDMEYAEEYWLLRSGADLDCDIMKVGNHGDNDTCSLQLVQAATPSIAVISTSSREKAETPDPDLVYRLTDSGAQVAVTQETDGGVLAVLTPGGAEVCYITLPENDSGIVITSLAAEEDRITLTNTGDQPVDLTDWYLLPERKDMLFIFPAGTALRPGESLTVGGPSAGSDADLLWDEKKIINRKKTDIVYLYDRHGVLVSEADNGL